MSDHAPRAFTTYLAVLGVVGGGLVSLALFRHLTVPGGSLGRSVSLVVAFVLAALIAELAPARLRSTFTVSLVTVVVFTALLTVGWTLAVLCSVGFGLASGLRNTERRLAKGVFNLGQMAIAAGAAAAVYARLGGAVLDPLVTGEAIAGSALISFPSLGRIAVTALVLTIVNGALVALVVWCLTGEAPHETLLSVAGSAAALQLVYALLAIVAAVLVQDAPAALVLMLVPLMVARAGLLGFQEQDQATDKMVRAFVKALEVKDGYTRGHSQRVAELTEKVAAEMGFGFNERRMAGYAALLHDIGKIGVPTAIITKRGPLDDDEFAAIKRHPTVGAEMLRDIDFLVPALDVVRHHHERFDGRGYPHGLSGERIPRLARMVSVVDAFDAMTSTRSYRRALPVETALEELDRCAGTQFDPEAVAALRAVIDREGWELTTAEVAAPVVSRAGQVRALAREVAG